MIYKETILRVVDNTGGIYAKCIGIQDNPVASIGDLITVSIVKALPNRKVKKGEIHKALIIRTKKGVSRPDGTYIQFNENAIIILEPELSPKGTRLFGPIPIEIASNSKIASLITKLI